MPNGGTTAVVHGLSEARTRLIKELRVAAFHSSRCRRHLEGLTHALANGAGSSFGSWRVFLSGHRPSRVIHVMDGVEEEKVLEIGVLMKSRHGPRL